MTNVETLSHDPEIVQPGEQIVSEAPAPQLPVVEGKLFDRAGHIEASLGGVRIESLAQVMDVSKLMSQSGVAVPDHCRGNTGICFALCLQALEWKMSPFAVANKSYVVNDRLAYESQLVHAVIEARGPLQKRLEVRYESEGETLICIVIGHLKGEPGPREWRSETLEKSRPPYKIKDGEKIYKGSPLWDKKPRVQMFYDTSRDFARIYMPDVLLGIYTADEMIQHEGLTDGTGSGARDITAEVNAASGAGAEGLHARLAAAQQTGEGFREGVVDAALNPATEAKDGDKTPPAASEVPPETEKPTASPPAGKVKPPGKEKPASRGKSKKAAPEPKEKEETAASPPPPPTDGPSYLTHLEAWLNSTDDHEEIDTRWKNEWKLRQQCGVRGGEAGNALLNMKNARLKELAP